MSRIIDEFQELYFGGDKVAGIARQTLERLRKKWAKVVEDVENPYLRDTVLPILLENQAVELANSKLLTETTTSGAIEPYPAFVFPLVRRVFPALIANEIVSVQPMTAPVGAVFYLDAIYGTTKGTITAGSPMFYQSPFDTSYSSAGATVTDNLTPTGNGVTGTLSQKPVYRGSVTVTGVFEVGGSDVTVTARDDGKGKISGSNGGVTITGFIDYFTGEVVLVASLDFKLETQVTVQYTHFVEASSSVSEVTYKISMKPVVAQTRKLKSSWSIETESDLKAYWGQSVDEALMAFQSVQLQTEVDRMIVDDLISIATGNTEIQDSWSVTPSSGLYPADSAEYIRTFVTKIGNVGSKIYKFSFNGSANFIVIPSEMQGRLSALPEMVVENPNPTGIARYGILSNKYKVYVNVHQDRTKVLVGYVGNTIIDSGYVYAPYVPIAFTPALYDPSSFEIKRGVFHRYGTAKVRDYYYGLITVSY